MSTDSTPAAKPYVVGFMFNEDFSKVALIRKVRPTWQAGFLNGVGGKVEADESPRDAMAREFAEETGFETGPDDWMHFMTMKGAESAATGIGCSFRVDFFAAVGPLERLRTMEEESVEITPTAAAWPGCPDMIDNLPWAIGLAMDCRQDGRPCFVTATYPI